MSSLNVGNYSFSLPWFIYDLSNDQLITSQTVPGDISDTKGVVLTETPIPGMNYDPVQPAGNNNRKISFTLPLLKRNNTVGNSLLLQQLHALRNQATGITSVFTNQFTANPKVIYYWGTGSVPLVYFVSKCDFTHKKNWINQMGVPQFSEVQMELILDENNIVYKAEQVYRKACIIAQTALQAYDTVSGSSGRTF